MGVFSHRNARETDVPSIVEIYNFAVATRTCSCDLEPVLVNDWIPCFKEHSADHRPLWVAQSQIEPDRGSIGYLRFSHFMNRRPGYFITSDLAIYLHPDFQGVGLGSYLLKEAIHAAPSLGIEVLSATIFASNSRSLALFMKHGFAEWGHMPRVARLVGVEKDLVLVGRRVD